MWTTLSLSFGVLFIIAINFVDEVHGADGSLLTCACNTQECRSQGSNRCIATNMCFVQYNPVGKLNRRKTEPIRGCINRSTPLLCENRPPVLSGDNQPAWPVLHCCSTPMCNRNIVPTSPPWLGPNPNSKTKNDSAPAITPPTVDDSEIGDAILSEPESDDDQNDSANSPSIQTILSQSSRVLTVEKVINVSDVSENGHFNWNLFYIILIPAIIVLIALVILAVTIAALKRRTDFLSTEDLVQAHKVDKKHHKKIQSRNLARVYVEEDILPGHEAYFSFQAKHI